MLCRLPIVIRIIPRIFSRDVTNRLHLKSALLHLKVNHVLLPFSFNSSQNLNLNLQILKYSSTQEKAKDFTETCKITLESICEYFEELIELAPEFKNGDVSYSDGVITAALGNGLGTYVINRQIPNKQIWLSSPTSGPKRYDFVAGQWIYKHDNTSLHYLLDQEIQLMTKVHVEFTRRCTFGKE